MSNKASDDLSYEDGGEDEEAKKDTSKEEDREQHSVIFGLQRM
jgi:hypothetical protein